jgi:hypothetical protein
MNVTFDNEKETMKSTLTFKLSGDKKNTPAVIEMVKLQITEIIHGHPPVCINEYADNIIELYPNTHIDTTFMTDANNMTEKLTKCMEVHYKLYDKSLLDIHIDFEIESTENIVSVNLTFNLTEKMKRIGYGILDTHKSNWLTPNPRNTQSVGHHQDGWDSIPPQQARCQDPYTGEE